MRLLSSIVLLIFFLGTYAQQKPSTTNDHVIIGTVVNQKTKLPMQGVSVINLNQVKGTSTNIMGSFQIQAQLNDVIHLSFIGFESLKVRVTQEWVDSKTTTIELIEKAIAIDEVEITGIVLTGFLEIDTKLIPLRNDYRYSISGLPHGYESREKPGSFNKVLNSVFNPVDGLHNLFGKKPKELRKLKEMKKDPTVKEVLASKFDRETLSAFLGVSKSEIEDILSNCNYSETFIRTANDLQILDAINECYEEYKVLNRK